MTSNTRGRLELDPSVCYRHPGRQSWTLCERCGRTICPECQVLTPKGVQCPECVRESGGSAQWQPAGPQRPGRGRSQRASRTSSGPRPAGASRGSASRPFPGSRSSNRRPAARLGGLFAALPGGAPVTWTILGIVVLLWIVGFALGNVPFYALAALPSAVLPGAELQLWRFVTAPLAYPSTFASILSLLLSGLFFGLSGPQLERQLGRGRYIGVLAISAVVSSAASLLAGQLAYGLTGPLFGLFGALLVLVWSDQRIRVQILVMIGLNLLLSLAFGGFGLPALVGGLLAGAGTMYVLHSAADHPRWRPHTPALWIGVPTAVLVLLAVARGVTS